MNVSDIIDELDSHGFADTETTEKLRVINDTIGDVCSREPWQFMEASEDVTLTAGDNTPTLPTNFRAMLTFIIPSEGRVLQPERLDTIAKTYPSSLTEQGVPYFYYFVGAELRVLPVPATTYTATAFFLKNHPTVTADTVEADILIPVRHHRVITLGSLAKLYAGEDDPSNAALFDSQYEARIQLMESDTWKKQYDRPDRIIDLWGDDDWYA